MDYYGLTHPARNSKVALFLWQKFLCPKNMHAFDEVWSPAHGVGKMNYLSCDACGLAVYISGISEKYALYPKRPDASND